MANFSINNLPRQVWAYYHPFYGTPNGPSGRWLLWNEPLGLSKGYGLPEYVPPGEVKEHLQHDPNIFLGPGRRSNYSAFYPTLGLYDCLDASILEKHATWAVEACLDGFLWDYAGSDDTLDKDKPLNETMYDRSLQIMLKVLDRLGLSLNLCPWYDTYCWKGFSVEKIVEHLRYLAQTYHGHPHMLHFDNRLVIYIYATFMKHSIADWWRVRKLLEVNGISDGIFLVAGEVAYHKHDLCEPGLFDGFSLYNYDPSDWSGDGVANFSKVLRQLAVRNGSKFWSAAVGPGFDGRIWHHPGRVVTRGVGKLYEVMWKQAIRARPNFITVCSFNEWGEGTQIEPCLEYESLYIELTAKWAKTFLKDEKVEPGEIC